MSSSPPGAAAASSSPSSSSKPRQLSKEEFVEYFSLLRKSNPSLTAQEFFAIVHKDHEAAQQQQHQATAAAASAGIGASATSPSSSSATPAATTSATPIVPDVASPVAAPVVATTVVDTSADTAAAAAASASSSSAATSPVVVNNVIRSKLFASPSSPAPSANDAPVAVPPTASTATSASPDNSQASSSTTIGTGSSVVSTPTTNNNTSATVRDTSSTDAAAAVNTGGATPPAETVTAAAASSSSPPTINIANLKDEIDKERVRLQQYIHQQNVLRYQEFKRGAEENARQREDIENVYARARPLPPPPAMALQRGAAAAGAPVQQPVAGAVLPVRRGIPERIGDGLRFLGQMDLFDMLLRYGLFALLISNGSWHVFFIIIACLCGYSIISYLLSLIEFRRGQAPQADPAAAAAPPTRQRRPQDCSTAFRVWYVCFKLFLLFFVSFLPWFKVEGLRRELHYEGVLYYPEDHLAAENPAAAAGNDEAPQEDEVEPAVAPVAAAVVEENEEAVEAQ